MYFFDAVMNIFKDRAQTVLVPECSRNVTARSGIFFLQLQVLYQFFLFTVKGDFNIKVTFTQSLSPPYCSFSCCICLTSVRNIVVHGLNIHPTTQDMQKIWRRWQKLKTSEQNFYCQRGMWVFNQNDLDQLKRKKDKVIPS